MTDDIGGLRADGMAKLRARELNASGRILESEHLGQKPLVENPRAFLEQAFDSKNNQEKRELFAKYVAAMDHTTRIAPADWVRELIKKDSYPPSSPIYNYVCRSGVFAANDAFYLSICNH